MSSYHYQYILSTIMIISTCIRYTKSFSLGSLSLSHQHQRSTWRSLKQQKQKYSYTRSLTTSSDDEEEKEGEKSLVSTNPEVLKNIKSSFLCTLRDRGFLYQCTNLEQLDEKLSSSEDKDIKSAYLGFDATANSLHVGSLLQIMILRNLQKSGHKPIILLGGGTSKVGDPTGKDESRKMLTNEDIQDNIDGISQVFRKFLTLEDEYNPNSTDAYMVNNDEWLSELEYLSFLRDYGTHFTINRMLNFESVKQRLKREAPLSFLEFNYMILQSYDFLELFRRYNTVLQLGGSDQWGNIISGVELGRKVDRAKLFGLTAPLMTTSDGKKMGKTANGAVWLNQDKLSEYDYWQFWRNTNDDDVLKFMKLFTELDMEEIEKLGQLEGADINKAKVILADEATTLLHGASSLPQIHKTISNMFSGKGNKTDTASLPRFTITKDNVGTISYAECFVSLGLATSRNEAKRLIKGGGAKINDNVKIDDINGILTEGDFLNDGDEVILRAGKKRAGVVEIK